MKFLSLDYEKVGVHYRLSLPAHCRIVSDLVTSGSSTFHSRLLTLANPLASSLSTTTLPKNPKGPKKGVA